MDRIYPAIWMSTPKPVRNHLVQVFDLVRTGVTEIRDQDVVSDGYTIDDLKKITLEAMCEYIGSTETFARAWEITVSKVHYELNPPVGEIGKADVVDEDTRPSVAELMSSKKNDKKTTSK